MSQSIRINKRRGYTVIPNGLLPEGKITARAWGIYAYLLSRPEGWVIHVRQLQQVFQEGRDAIYTALKQLVEVGLLEMESYKDPGQPPKKRYAMVDLDELLLDSPDPGNPDTGNQDKASPEPDSQDTGLPDTGNQDRKSRTLTTTDISTTEDSHLLTSLRSEENKNLNQKNPLKEVPLRGVDTTFFGEDENEEMLHASRQQHDDKETGPPPPDASEILDELWPDRKKRKAS